MDQKTILIFSTAYLPLLGGAEIAVKEITDRIDHTFFLITTRFSSRHLRREKIGNVDVFRVGSGRLGYLDKLLSPFLGALLARRLMRRHRVHLFWPIMASFTSGAPFLLKVFGLSKGIPILLTLQEGDSERWLTRRHLGIIYLSWRAALKVADRIQVISAYLERLARKRGARAPIETVPNGVDVKKFKNRELRIKNHGDPWVVITTSRLVEKNGIDVLIKAVATLDSNVRLRIVGTGPLEKELKELVKRLDSEGKVEFAGAVPYEHIPHELSHADIFARSSRSEGLGSSFLEAMAAGLPIIGTNVGGIPDFLTHGETGLFAHVDDPQDLAEKIELLMRDSELRERISKKGQELVEKNYSWDIVAEKMETIFGRMITL